MREGFELPAAAAGVAGGAGTEGPLWVAGGSINDDEGGPGVKSRGAPSPMVDKPDPPPSHAIVSPWYPFGQSDTITSSLLKKAEMLITCSRSPQNRCGRGRHRKSDK